MSGTPINSYKYKEQHVTSATSDNFLSAARCIVYAQADESGAGGVNEGEYFPIGLVQGYNWSEQKQIDMLFELGSEVPFLVPGRTTGQISLSRVLLFGKDLVNVLHGKEDASNQEMMKSLRDITKPINLMFVSFGNVTEADEAPSQHYSRIFKNAWISSRNESIGAGQTIIAENCNIMYEKISNVDSFIANK